MFYRLKPILVGSSHYASHFQEAPEVGELGQALAVVLHGARGASGLVDVEQVPCGEVPEERPSSVLGLALAKEHQGGPQPAWIAFMGLIQEQLEAMLASLTKVKQQLDNVR